MCKVAALFSGGKDSMYVIYRWYLETNSLPDYLLFIKPKWESPHELNVHVAYLLARLLDRKLVITTSEELADTLRRLDVDLLLAADVYMYDHVYWLEKVCRQASVNLYEPLLNRDTYWLLREIIDSGIEFLIVGTRPEYERLLGLEVSKQTLNMFEKLMQELNIDPVGEHGEYHTLVLTVPLTRYRLKVQRMRTLRIRKYVVIIVMPTISHA